jgi:general secretion pathway protein K
MSRRVEKKRLYFARVRRRRGVALILVLGALTILSVMLTESQDESSADFAAALTTRDQLIGEYAAKSAVNLSRLLIAAEPTIRTAIGPMLMLMMPGGPPPQIPVWEHAERALGAFNDGEGVKGFALLAGVDTTLGKNLGFQGAGFDIRIIDEDSKINVNASARGEAFSKARLGAQLAGLMSGPQYDPLFSSKDSDGQFSDRSAVCAAIIDFADPDQDQDHAFCELGSATAQAATPEDSFYTLLPHPYERKNAAFDSLEELRRVRGMSEDFWATFVDPDPDAPDRRVLTVWGQGAVNVNTANPQTILALVCSQVDPLVTPMCSDPAEATKFLMALSMVRGFTRGAPLFGSAKVFIAALKGTGMFGGILAALEVQPVQLKSDAEFEKLVSTESKVFSIYATGRVGSGSRQTTTRLHVVVDFRNAPPPGTDTRMLDAAKRVAEVADPTGAAVAQIDAVLKPQPGGSIVYFRNE